MSEMIEQVAKAIFASDWPKDDWSRFKADDYAPCRYRRMARAAIEALWWPIDAMFVAGDEKILETLNDHTFALSSVTPSVKCWQAMISAALQEKEAGE